MRVELEPAWILHRRPYRETSLLLDALTLNHGRIGLVARGARRGGRSRRFNTEPFQRLALSWSGRGELMNLSGVETTGLPRALPGRRLWTGLYANELLIRLVQRGDPCAEVFTEYSELLECLDAGEDEQSALRRFEVRMLQHLGYGLILDTEMEQGGAVLADRNYEYLLETGPVPCPDRPGGDGYRVCGATLLALASGELRGDGVRREAKFFMRHILRHYLGDRPLQTLRLFQAGT